MLNIVNGYVCYNCTDVDNAKKGIDPAHPKQGVSLQPQTKTQSGFDAADNPQMGPSVILSGALANLDATNSTASVSSSNASHQPSSLDAPYTLVAGTRLNISA